MTIARTKKGSIVFSLKHRPPLTMTMIGAILLILMSSKEQLIDSLPISNAETVAALGAWYIYILKGAGVLVGLANIVLGLDKSDTKSAYGNFDANKTTQP